MLLIHGQTNSKNIIIYSFQDIWDIQEINNKTIIYVEINNEKHTEYST